MASSSWRTILAILAGGASERGAAESSQDEVAAVFGSLAMWWVIRLLFACSNRRHSDMMESTVVQFLHISMLKASSAMPFNTLLILSASDMFLSVFRHSASTSWMYVTYDSVDD